MISVFETDFKVLMLFLGSEIWLLEDIILIPKEPYVDLMVPKSIESLADRVCFVEGPNPTLKLAVLAVPPRNFPVIAMWYALKLFCISPIFFIILSRK